MTEPLNSELLLQFGIQGTGRELMLGDHLRQLKKERRKSNAIFVLPTCTDKPTDRQLQYFPRYTETNVHFDFLP